jgi:HSP20 family molecular chaperone IbpA
MFMEGGGKEHRFMVEDIAVTPFFRRHGSHMPATIKLHAEVREERNEVVLETGIAGYEKDDVQVSATPNTIEVTLVLERNKEGDVKFHNSYFTPVPIQHEKIRVEHGAGILKVRAPKK